MIRISTINSPWRCYWTERCW